MMLPAAQVLLQSSRSVASPGTPTSKDGTGSTWAVPNDAQPRNKVGASAGCPHHEILECNMFPALSQLCFCSVSCFLAPGSTNIPSLSSYLHPHSFPDCTQPLKELCSLSWPLFSQSWLSKAVCSQRDNSVLGWASREELGLGESSPAVECSWAARDNGNDHGNSCCPCLDHLGVTSAPCPRWSPVLSASPFSHRCPHLLWHDQDNAPQGQRKGKLQPWTGGKGQNIPDGQRPCCFSSHRGSLAARNAEGWLGALSQRAPALPSL